MNRIITFSFFFLMSVLVLAQQRAPGNEDKWEKYRSEKIAFLTSNLDLTPSEAQRFWPVYNQLEKERWEGQKLRRELEEKVLEAEETMSDHKIKTLTREFASSMKKEADVLATFNEKFLEILPPHKVLKLYKSENEFRMYMIKKYRDKKRGED